jgi:hypothetical protein
VGRLGARWLKIECAWLFEVDASFDGFGLGITREEELDGNRIGYWVIGVNLRKRIEWPRKRKKAAIFLRLFDTDKCMVNSACG